MPRAVIFSRETNVNIKADRFEEQDGIVRIFDNNQLVGVFDVEVVSVAYISNGELKTNK